MLGWSLNRLVWAMVSSLLMEKQMKKIAAVLAILSMLVATPANAWYRYGYGGYGAAVGAVAGAAILGGIVGGLASGGYRYGPYYNPYAYPSYYGPRYPYANSPYYYYPGNGYYYGW